MKDIKIYETTAGLGYNQKALLIKIGEATNFSCYMVIDTIGLSDEHNTPNYEIGNIIADLEEFYINEITFDYKLEDSPLYNNLTKFLLENK